VYGTLSIPKVGNNGVLYEFRKIVEVGSIFGKFAVEAIMGMVSKVVAVDENNGSSSHCSGNLCSFNMFI
jgi:precorrin-6B methylase 2